MKAFFRGFAPKTLFICFAINCKVESVLCKGEENPLVRASGFPLPLRSPTFPQRCLGATAPKNPATVGVMPQNPKSVEIYAKMKYIT